MGRHRLLVPEARERLHDMKLQVLSELQQDGVLTHTPLPSAVQSSVPEGGLITTKQAGEKGGATGGRMVQRLIELAKDELLSHGPQQ